MKHISHRTILSFLCLVFALSLAGSPIVLAHDEDGVRGSDDSASSVSADDSTARKTSETEIHKRELLEKFKKTAQDKNKAQRENVKQRSAEFRQKACEARKTSMINRLSNKVPSAEKHKTVFDNIFNRVKTFHDSENLNTPGYDELVAKVEAAQTETASQVAALKAIDISIDCTKADVADTLSTFREALSHTRDALKTYRESLVNLIKAVHESNN